MPDPVFGDAYSTAYDVLYKDKDYEAESDLLQDCMGRFLPGGAATILDLGCGTGSHCLALARRGYRVHGLDRSESMLDSARDKFRRLGGAVPEGAVTFSAGDVATTDLGELFDVAIMMFAVLGYQVTNERLIGTLRNVRHHLRPGGLFICDFWYGPAVLSQRPGERTRDIVAESRRIVRSARTDLDTFRQVARVQFDLHVTDGGLPVTATREVHEMRFFFPQEIGFFLAESGFGMASLTAFPSLDTPVDDSTWNALLVARAC